MTLLKFGRGFSNKGKSLTADDADKAQHTTAKVWLSSSCAFTNERLLSITGQKRKRLLSCFQFIGFIREDSRNSRQKDFAFLKSVRLPKKY
jgi:hypothetical protein